MSTAVAPLREQDGVTATGPFDHGGGRVDVAAAAQATLVMEIADDEFAAANPDGGGRPQALNLAGLVDLACVGQCSWTRRVQATVAGTWLASASAQDGIDVRVAPESFSLDAGQTQELTIDVSAGAALDDGSRSGEIVLMPQTPGAAQAPPSRLPLVVNWLGDGDGDGVANVQDNCLELPNADQRDTNDDGFGNRCDADLNDDGTTNVQDLGIMRARFFSADPDADLDGDGVVAQSDLQILAARFFLPPGPAAGL